MGEAGTLLGVWETNGEAYNGVSESSTRLRPSPGLREGEGTRGAEGRERGARRHDGGRTTVKGGDCTETVGGDCWWREEEQRVLFICSGFLVYRELLERERGARRHDGGRRGLWGWGCVRVCFWTDSSTLVEFKRTSRRE